MSTPITETPRIDGPAVAEYVGDRSNGNFAAECAEQAVSLVARYLGTRAESVPVSVVRRAQLEVASELFYRKDAPNGITQFATPDGGTGIRVARDPMLGAYPILDRFLPGGFA